MQYTNQQELSVEQLATVFKKAGLSRPVNNQQILEKMLSGASILWTAWDGDRLVGVARALIDYGHVCYLADLAVIDEYQHQGIGRKLVDNLKEQLGKDVTLVLFAAPGAMNYYSKLGFKNVNTGFMILGDAQANN